MARVASLVPPAAQEVLLGLRMMARLPRYLRRPLDTDQARAVLAGRLARREQDFLELMRRTVWADPASPYRPLLARAGCAASDLERLVADRGLEGALLALYRGGVHLSVDEFKGRVAARRGGESFVVAPERLVNPLVVGHLRTSTGGSRGPGTVVLLDLASLRDRAVNMHLALEARGGAAWRKAVWATPGLGPLLWNSFAGAPPAAWFSQLDVHAPGVHPRYRWSCRALAWTSRLAGVPLPRVEYVPVDRPLAVARWLAGCRRKGHTPHLWGFVSSVLAVCRAAVAGGVDISGSRFTVTGEPLTRARLQVIRQAGGDAVPDYGSADSGGSMSHGCLAPRAPDDVHLFDDLNALVQVHEPPLPAGALLVTSLRLTAPIVLLNVSMGDRATLLERACGCPLEGLGWRTHLQDVRSFEKLTAGGMTFIDSDVIAVLEEVLPDRFGGGPTDYQLVEEEGSAGEPRLVLRVDPRVGALDPAAVAEAFLAALGGGSTTARVMVGQWRQAALLRVERVAPRRTASGKVLHLSAPAQPRSASSPPPPGGEREGGAGAAR